MTDAHASLTRLGRRRADLLVVQQASSVIAELGETLDRQLLREQRPAERLRMLRATTNRITRAANDAILAYGRVRTALATENAMEDGDRSRAAEIEQALSAARADVMSTLAAINDRYAWGYAQEAAPVAAQRGDGEGPVERER